MNNFATQMEGLLGYIERNGANLNRLTQNLLSELLTEVNQFISPPIETTISPETGRIWQLSGGNPGVFINYLRNNPDQALRSLINHPEQLQEVIRRLQENAPQERNRESDGIPQAPIQSSNIWGFAYSQPERKLYAKFQGDGIYQYSNVPPQVFNQFQQGAVPARTEGENNYGMWWRGKQPSLGASLHQLIKQQNYPYERVA